MNNTKREDHQLQLGIPEYEMESLARMLLPILKKYIDSEEGKRDWQEWQARMNDGANSTMSTKTKDDLNNLLNNDYLNLYPDLQNELSSYFLNNFNL